MFETGRLPVTHQASIRFLAPPFLLLHYTSTNQPNCKLQASNFQCVNKSHNLCPPTLRDAPTATQSVQGRLGEFSPQSISNLITALCKLRVTAQPEWMSAAVNQLHRSKEPAGPQATANVLWALAKMGYSFNTQGLDAMVSLVARRLPAFQSSQQLPSSDSSSISSGSSLPSSDRQSYNTQVGFHMRLTG